MRYKERIIEHNLHKPREYHTDTLELQEVDFEPSVISHHPKSFEYYFTHGLVVNDRRYIVKEFFVKYDKLYAILTEDEDTYYEMYLSFLDENVIEDLKKDISDLKVKDKQFDKRLSDLENNKKKNQTLSINDHTISISGGNSIELPEVSVIAGKRIKVVKDGNTYTVEGTPTEIVKLYEKDKNPLVTLDKEEKFNSLRFSTIALTQKITELENKKQTISKQDNKIVLSNGGGEVELPTYDDTSLREQITTLENKPDKDTKYTVKGNGLFLDDDNSFHLEMQKTINRLLPYKSNGEKYIKLSPAIRYPDEGNRFLIYAVDNDGTLQKNAVLEAGIFFGYDGSYRYDNQTVTFDVKTEVLSVLSTNTDFVTGCVSVLHPRNIKFETELESVWNENNKVVLRINPKIVWSIDLESHTEYYTHYVTKEEMDSEEPIIIEIYRGETLVGNLTMTLKNTKFFMQSVQGNILLKNPTDNKFYNIPRFN